MKLPLVGQSFALRSPAAAVQQTLNLFPQFMDDPNEQAKNKGILELCPGYHLMGNITALGGGANEVVRGSWSGGGRLFVVTDNNHGVAPAASTLYEIGLGTYVGGNPSAGSVTRISTNGLSGASSDSSPAQLFGDGNQLAIVKNGSFYIDSGFGPEIARFQTGGTCDTVSNGNGTSNITWDTGDQFNPTVPTITINGVAYSIANHISATSLQLNEDAGDQFKATFSMAGGDPVDAVTGTYLDGYFIVQRTVGKHTIGGTLNVNLKDVTWLSGSFFDDLLPGDSITFVGTGTFTVDQVLTPTHLTITASAGVISPVFTALVGSDLGRQFNISAPFDGSSWDPLDFSTKEGYPDYIQSILADHEQLYLFGTEESEVWQNTGDPTFPFQRIGGAAAREGSIARYAPVAMSEKVYFLGGSPRGTPVAYRLDGFTPVRISTHAEEQAWASGIDTPSGAVAYAEVHDGHQFWVINFPGSLFAWVYDATASEQAGSPMWHQRARWDGAALQSYAPRFHTFIPEWGPAGMHVGGDFASANLYELNLNYADDAGTDKKWSRTLPHTYNGGKKMYYGRMTLEMETGTTTSLTVQPPVTREYSDDRGRTFSHALQAITGGAGVANATAQRVFWAGTSSSPIGRAFRLSGTTQFRTTLIDLDVDTWEGTV